MNAHILLGRTHLYSLEVFVIYIVMSGIVIKGKDR